MSVIALQVFHVGDDWDFTATLQNPDGSIMNLTGASITWKLDSLNLTKNFVTLITGNGVTITNAAAGQVAYGPTAAQTSPLAPGTYYQTLKVTLASGQEFTMVEGLINALAQAT